MVDNWEMKEKEYKDEEKGLHCMLNSAFNEGALPERDYYDIRHCLVVKTVPFTSWSFFTGVLGSLKNAYIYSFGMDSLTDFRKEVSNMYREYFKEYVYSDLADYGHPKAAQLLYENRWLDAAAALGTIDTTAKYSYRHRLLSQGDIEAPSVDHDEIERKVQKGELARA